MKKQLDEFVRRLKELEESKRARAAEKQQLQTQISQQNLSDAEVQRLTTDRQNLDDQVAPRSDVRDVRQEQRPRRSPRCCW